METMVALYCQNRCGQTESIQLFAELVDMEPAEDFTPLSEEHGVQDPCTVVPKAYIDRRLTIHEIDIDINAPPASKNLNSDPRLQIHLVVIEINADGDDGYDNNDHSDHEVEDYSDLDLNKVSDDIDSKGANDNGNVTSSSVGNSSRGIVIHNDPEAHMSIIDPDAMYAFEFSKYLDIQPTHRLAVDPEREELLVGQKFATKEDCVFVIKRHDLNMTWMTNYNREEEFSIRCFGRSIYVCEHFPTASHLRRELELTLDSVYHCGVREHGIIRIFPDELVDLETFQVIDFIGHRLGIPPRFYRVDLRNRWSDYGNFQILRYLYTHVIAACARASINVE
ncbi:hypothetical protein GOBAR_DD22835 [Gossypium barbadense]|nr:hypothetical protein GOBAR_DD22835 [Gossypium barbadense]